ncbi:ABC transporter permease [Sphingomonas sp. I4]
MLASHERRLIARYLWPGAGGRLVLLVAAIGCIGVAIGVASLVLVVAVMNGAQAKLASTVAPVDGHLSITAAAHQRMNETQVAAIVARLPGVARAEPLREVTTALSVDGRISSVRVQGLTPEGIAHHPALVRPAMGYDRTHPAPSQLAKMPHCDSACCPARPSRSAGSRSARTSRSTCNCSRCGFRAFMTMTRRSAGKHRSCSARSTASPFWMARPSRVAWR